MENKSMKKEIDKFKTTKLEYLMIFILFLPQFLLVIFGVLLTILLIGGMVKLFTIWF